MLRASAAGKTRARPRATPRSREALLCGQVKTLLQKVDEEVVMPVRIHALLGVSRSPAQLLAPTPANTPQLGVESAAAARGEPVLPDGIKMAMSCVLEEEETLPKLQPAGREGFKYIMLVFSSFPTQKGEEGFKYIMLMLTVIWIVTAATMKRKPSKIQRPFYMYALSPSAQLKKVASARCVNRIRRMTQEPHICATWGDTGHV